jgi:hypothetical protein
VMACVGLVDLIMNWRKKNQPPANGLETHAFLT